MNENLCGVNVDRDGYNRFSVQTYQVPGDYLTRPRTLKECDMIAKSSDFRENLPELSAACQRICNHAAEEIREFYRKRDGRKEYKEMKHSNFTGYIKDLQEIHAKVATERKKLYEEFKAAQEKMERANRELKHDKVELARNQLMFVEAENKYKSDLKTVQKMARDEIEQLKTEFKKHVEDFYSASGDRLDDSMVKLLNSGLILTDKELDGMIERSRGNTTMLRLITQYCSEHDRKTPLITVYGSAARTGGKEEIGFFDEFEKIIYKSVGDDGSNWNAWSVEAGGFERLSNQVIDKLNNQLVRPQESGNEM